MIRSIAFWEGLRLQPLSRRFALPWHFLKSTETCRTTSVLLCHGNVDFVQQLAAKANFKPALGLTSEPQRPAKTASCSLFCSIAMLQRAPKESGNNRLCSFSHCSLCLMAFALPHVHSRPPVSCYDVWLMALTTDSSSTALLHIVTHCEQRKQVSNS